MPEKKQTNKPLIIIFSLFSAVVFLFTIYETLVVGNPFFDPVQPYVLWILLSGAAAFFIARYASRGE